MIVARVTGSDQQRGLVVKMAEEKPKAADDGHKGKKGAEEKRAPGNERAAWRGVKSGEPDAPRDWKPKAIGRLSAYFAVALLLAFVAVKMGLDGTVENATRWAGGGGGKTEMLRENLPSVTSIRAAIHDLIIAMFTAVIYALPISMTYTLDRKSVV